MAFDRQRHATAPFFIFFSVLCSVACREADAVSIELPLLDHELNCCTIAEAPIVFPDSTKVEKFGGIAIEYLQQLELKLGFRCASLDLYNASDGGNGTFTQFIMEMEKCTENGTIRKDDPACTCEMGVGGWNLNDQRLGRADFIEPFALDFYRVMTHTNNTRSPIGDVFFFTAFDTTVWICVFSLMGVFALLKILDRTFAPIEESEKEPPMPDASMIKRFSHAICTNKTIIRIQQAFRSVATHMMGHTTPEVPGDTRRTRQWILNIVIFLSGLFLVLTYEASMTAALVNETWTSNFNGLDDFKECRIPASQVCIVQGSGVHSFWKAAVESEPCHEGDNRPKVQTKDTFAETFEHFISYKCRYMIALEVQLEQLLRGRYCSTLRLTGDEFREVETSFVLPFGSNLTVWMSNATLEMRNSGQIPSAEAFLAAEGECNGSDFQSVTFVKLIWFFVLVFIAIGLIFCLLVGTRLMQLRKRARTSASSEDTPPEIVSEM